MLPTICHFWIFAWFALWSRFFLHFFFAQNCETFKFHRINFMLNMHNSFRMALFLRFVISGCLNDAMKTERKHNFCKFTVTYTLSIRYYITSQIDHQKVYLFSFARFESRFCEHPSFFPNSTKTIDNQIWIKKNKRKQRDADKQREKCCFHKWKLIATTDVIIILLFVKIYNIFCSVFCSFFAFIHWRAA